MSARGRDGLGARIRQLRRISATTDMRPDAAPTPDPVGIDAIEDRVAHLERLVQGLQDSVHRESERQGKRLAELETRLEPAALTAAMSKDARDRGL
jgi:hypothetical protein